MPRPRAHVEPCSTQSCPYAATGEGSRPLPRHPRPQLLFPPRQRTSGHLAYPPADVGGSWRRVLCWRRRVVWNPGWARGNFTAGCKVRLQAAVLLDEPATPLCTAERCGCLLSRRYWRCKHVCSSAAPGGLCSWLDDTPLVLSRLQWPGLAAGPAP